MKKLLFLTILVLGCLGFSYAQGGGSNYCQSPYFLSATPTDTTAVLTWNSSAPEFELAYRSYGGTWMQVTGITDTFYNLSGLTACSGYGFRVKALCDSTSSSWWSYPKYFTTTGCPPPCNAPTQLTATADDTSAVLSWSGSAVSYDVTWKASNGNWTTVAGVTDTFLNLSGLDDCRRHYFTVKANCSTGITSSSSYRKTFYTSCPPPCYAPFYVSVSADTSMATITWSGSAASYDLRYSEAGTNSYTEVLGITDTFAMVSGLMPCTKYYFNVKSNCSATSSSGWSYSKSSTTLGCPPPCYRPIQLSATADTSSVMLSWTGTAAAYEIRYREAGTSTYTALTGVTDTFVNVTGLMSCTKYYFEVRSICSATQTSSWSFSKHATTIGCPPPCYRPTQLSATADTSSVMLSWTGTAAAYEIRYREAGTSTYTTLTGVTDTFMNVTGLMSCTKYYFNVRSTCSATQNSSWSFSKRATTIGCPPPCYRPTQLSATADTSSVMLSWTGTAAAYEIRYREAGASTYTTLTGVTDTFMNVTGLMSCTKYYFNVRSTCSATQNSSWSYTKSVITTGCPPPCFRPTGLSASAMDTTATLSWSGTTASYEVYYKAAGGSWTTLTGITDTFVNITGLTSCKRHYFRVKAICSATSSSNLSSTKRFYTTGCPPIAPRNSSETELAVEFGVYPNPGSAQLNVRYDLVEKGEVTLELYNLQGQKVRTLINETQVEGSYTLRFNEVGTLASGTYYLMQRINGVVQTKTTWVKL